MPHICSDEILMFMTMIPFAGFYFKKIHDYWHVKLNHKCHKSSCDKQHLDH